MRCCVGVEPTSTPCRRRPRSDPAEFGDHGLHERPGQAVGRWLRPLCRLRGRVVEPVGLHPAPRDHPACMPDHAQAVLQRLPASSACQHLLQALAAARPVMQEVGDPGVDLRSRDVRPRLAVPGAEVRLQQGVINDVSPAEPAKVMPHRPATRQRRGADQARQAMRDRMPVNAAGQAPGLAWVDMQFDAADAEPGRQFGSTLLVSAARLAASAASTGSPLPSTRPAQRCLRDLPVPVADGPAHLPGRPRMAPGHEAHRLSLRRHRHQRCCGCWAHHTDLTRPDARHGATQARWRALRAAGWRRGCRP